MSNERAGALIGALSFIVLCGILWIFTWTLWQHQIADAQHNPNWAHRTGYITAQNPDPNFSSDPPYRQSTVQFSDFFGQKNTVTLDMAYGSRVGNLVRMDVSRNGSVYSYDTVDGTNQASKDPFKVYRHDSFLPETPLVIGPFFLVVVSALIGSKATERLPSRVRPLRALINWEKRHPLVELFPVFVGGSALGDWIVGGIGPALVGGTIAVVTDTLLLTYRAKKEERRPKLKSPEEIAAMEEELGL